MSEINSKNKIKSLRGRSNKNNSAPNVEGSNRRQIAITAFDLLNGEYVYTEKN